LYPLCFPVFLFFRQVSTDIINGIISGNYEKLILINYELILESFPKSSISIDVNVKPAGSKLPKPPMADVKQQGPPADITLREQQYRMSLLERPTPLIVLLGVRTLHQPIIEVSSLCVHVCLFLAHFSWSCVVLAYCSCLSCVFIAATTLPDSGLCIIFVFLN
jgi:hypothetical protein